MPVHAEGIMIEPLVSLPIENGTAPAAAAAAGPRMSPRPARRPDPSRRAVIPAYAAGEPAANGPGQQPVAHATARHPAAPPSIDPNITSVRTYISDVRWAYGCVATPERAGRGLASGRPGRCRNRGRRVRHGRADDPPRPRCARRARGGATGAGR